MSRGYRIAIPEPTDITVVRGSLPHYRVYCLGRQVAKIQKTLDGTSYEVEAVDGCKSILYGRIHGTRYPTLKATINRLNQFPCFHRMGARGSRYGVSLDGVLQGTLELKKKKWLFKAEGGSDHKKYGFMDELTFKSLDYAISVIVTSTFL